MRISDWSSDVCSSDLQVPERGRADFETRRRISLACKAGEIKSDVGRGSVDDRRTAGWRSETEHDKVQAGIWTRKPSKIGRAPSELQSLMRISYAVFCLKKKIEQRNLTIELI